MKFTSDSDDIPDELVQSVLNGKTAFLSGAGVSMQADLPSFKRLTLDIYDEIGDNIDFETPELEAFENQDYGRVLALFEKRISEPNLPSRVREIVAKKLQFKQGADLSCHKSLLRLSSNEQGQIRILTTNFDTYFEHAAVELGLPYTSYAGKSIPKPGTAKDYGIIHIHGHIRDPKLRIKDSKLILTSSDFGEPYMLDGWITKYIVNRLKIGPIVIVGYGAEDVTMRSLLEAIGSNRSRYADLNDIFVFDVDNQSSTANWDLKGTKLIGFQSYFSIYHTLKEWAKFKSNPESFAKSKIISKLFWFNASGIDTEARIKLLKKNLQDTNEYEQTLIRDLSKFFDINELILKLNPNYTWLPFFIELKIQIPSFKLEEWLSMNFDDYNTIKMVVSRIDYFSKDSVKHLRKLLNKTTKLDKVYRECWHFIFMHVEQLPDNQITLEWYRVEQQMNSGGNSAEITPKLVNLLKPQVAVRLPYWPANQGEHAQFPKDLINIAFDCDRMFGKSTELTDWIKKIDDRDATKLLEQLISTLEDSLNDALRAGVEFENHVGKSDLSVLSIAKHDQDEYQHEFYPIVRAIVATWDKIAKSNQSCAKKFVVQWSSSNYRLIRRLALYAAKKKFISSNLVFEILNTIPIRDLFLASSSVESYQLIKTRWNSLSKKQKTDIEKRINLGPPTECFIENKEERVDCCRFQLLGFMKYLNLEMTKLSQSTLAEIKRKYPKWKLRDPKRAGFHLWTDSSGELIPINPQVLLEASDYELINTALDSNSVDWQEFCKQEPKRAIKCLVHSIESHGWLTNLWKSFFQSHSENQDGEVIHFVMKGLSKCPADKIKEISYELSIWIQYSTTLLLKSANLWELWDKVFNSLPEEIEPDKKSDLFTHSINSGVGYLAHTLVMALHSCNQEESTITKEILPRLNKIISLKNSIGLIARVRLVENLLFLFRNLPEWTKDKFIPCFDWQFKEAIWMWRAYKYQKYIVPPVLFGLLKNGLIKFLEQKDIDSLDIEILLRTLIRIAIYNKEFKQEYLICNTEIRRIVRLIGSKSLAPVASEFVSILRETDEIERSEKWVSVVKPVFTNIWPNDQHLKTSATNETLIELTKFTSESFADAAQTVKEFLVKKQTDSDLSIYQLSELPTSFFDESPELILEIVNKLAGDSTKLLNYKLDCVLDKIQNACPELNKTKEYQRLANLIEKA